MNKRIKELATEAEIKFEAHLHHLGIDTAVITPADLEKFAELIVQECANVAMLKDTNTDSYDYNSGRTWAGIDILKNFGVEE
jgi:hypothetical protein